MKFGQLIEYNIRNILLKNHTQNMVEKLFKKSKFSISLDQYRKVLNSLFLLYANLRAIEIQQN